MPFYQYGQLHFFRNPFGETKKSEVPSAASTPQTDASKNKERGGWGNDIEFLMSCIAMSVGLGNVWRFPFTALENGGGELTFWIINIINHLSIWCISIQHSFWINYSKIFLGAFLIPYLIVLVIIGRPLYYLEMLLGQFSGRSSLKVFDLAPAMRGKVGSQLLTNTFTIWMKKNIVLFFVVVFLDSRRWLWASHFNGNRRYLLCQHHGNYIALFFQFIQIDITMDGTFAWMGWGMSNEQLRNPKHKSNINGSTLLWVSIQYVYQLDIAAHTVYVCIPHTPFHTMRCQTELLNLFFV